MELYLTFCVYYSNVLAIGFLQLTKLDIWLLLQTS